MLPSITGTYRNGKIELTEKPIDMPDDTRVIVTFLKSTTINLKDRGIDKSTAAELRNQLTAFIEDWESTEMDMYDDYDAAQAKL